MKNTRMLSMFGGCCVASLATIVLAGGGSPACLMNTSLDGGACSKRTDTTDPKLCPDFVISSDECTNTQQAAKGYSTRSGYWSACRVRESVWNGTSCIQTELPPMNFRCYEATGSVCPGGGCPGGC